jgi:hypothetical protein
MCKSVKLCRGKLASQLIFQLIKIAVDCLP